LSYLYYFITFFRPVKIEKCHKVLTSVKLFGIIGATQFFGGWLTRFVIWNAEGEPAMFVGEFHHKADAKGRVSVPSEFRSAGDGKFYVTYGPDGCLFVYDEAGFNKHVAQFSQFEDFDSTVRRMKRVFFSGPPPQPCDISGRIKLPGHLIAHAQIKRDVVLIGMQDYFEMWGKETWDKRHEQDLADYDKNYSNMPNLVKKRPSPGQAPSQDHNG